MNNENLIQQKILETRRYEFNDGLRDIQIGAFLLLMGVFNWMVFEPFWWKFLFSIRERAGSVVMVLTSWIAFFLPVLIAIGFLQLMKILRRKWLWRQSGMVKSARWVVPRKVSFISVIIFVAGLVLGVVYQKVMGEETLFLMRLLYAMAGVSFAYALLAMGKILQLNRYILLGVVGGVVSVLLLGLPLTPGVFCLVLFSCWFLLLMISGALTMLKSIQNMKRDAHGG